MKNISPVIKIYLFPLISLVVLVGLFAFAVTNGYSRIVDLKEKVDEGEKQVALLQEKVDILSKIDPNVINKSELSVQSLPSEDASPRVLSQLRHATETNGSILERVETNSVLSLNKELNETEIEWQASAESLDSMLIFLQDIQKFIPLVTIHNVAIDTIPTTSFKLELKDYWAAQPTTLPPLTAPVDQLSESQIELLEALSGYSKPSFEILEPQDPTDRENPFE